MRRNTQTEDYQIKGKGFIVKTYEERIVNKDEKGYYVIGKKEPPKIYLKDFEKKLEQHEKNWQYLCERMSKVK